MRYWNFVRKYSVLVILVGWVSLGNAQFSFDLIRKIPHKANFLETDILGNIYLMDGDGIRKYDLEGNKVQETGQIAFGDETSLDATDPLKILVYYRDYGQISILDNGLGARGERLKLDELGVFGGNAICRSYNNAIWVFDQVNVELVRFGEQLEIINRSRNLQQLLGYVPNPIEMHETSKNLYLNDPEKGILVFDIYASYYKTITIKGIAEFKIRERQLFYRIDDQLYAYDLVLGENSEKLMELNKAIDFSLIEDKLIVLRVDGVYIYSVKVQ